jgi:hypothetical protein
MGIPAHNYSENHYYVPPMETPFIPTIEQVTKLQQVIDKYLPNNWSENSLIQTKYLKRENGKSFRGPRILINKDKDLNSFQFWVSTFNKSVGYKIVDNKITEVTDSSLTKFSNKAWDRWVDYDIPGGLQYAQDAGILEWDTRHQKTDDTI